MYESFQIESFTHPNFFDIVTGMLQGETLEPFNLPRPNENHKKQTISNRNYVDSADGLALLANIPAQAYPLLHSFELAASGTDPYVK